MNISPTSQAKCLLLRAVNVYGVVHQEKGTVCYPPVELRVSCHCVTALVASSDTPTV